MSDQFILDTSAYSAFYRGDIRLRTWINEDHSILVPLIVIGELKAGFIIGTKAAENNRLLERFTDASNVNVISLTSETPAKFAQVFAGIRKSGVAIGSNDLWIAALALEFRLPILTLDKDFHRISGITTIPL